MSRTVFRFCAFLLLLSLLLLWPRQQPDRSPAALQSMPPHPRLEEKIKRGEVSLPRFLTDPAAAQSLGLDRPGSGPHALTGTLRALAVLVDFSDNVHTVTPTFFDSLIFAAPVAGRGSVRDYFQEVSYAQVDLVTVNLPSSLGWQRAPQTYSYYVGGQNCTDAPYPNNCQKLAEDIVDAVNSLVDFSPYDNNRDGYAEPIMLIHAGPGGEFTGNKNDMWSHSRSLKNPRSYDGVTIADYVLMPEYQQTKSASSSDMTIGVFAHEMGHGFWGLPDLYDRTPDSSSDSYGIGNWSLMAGGSWNGPDRDGSSPAWPDAWSRLQMGFITVTNVTSDTTGQSIPQVYNNPSEPTVLKLRSPALGSQEYFLLENRQQVPGSYDEYLPGSGLFIWHVDEAMNTYELQNDYRCLLEPHCLCLDNQHYLVALEQADGQRDLEHKNNAGDTADPFPGSTNNRAWTMTTNPENSSWYACTNTCIGVSNISNSGDTMTADLQVSCGESSWHVYLPLVLKKYSPAPALTPTPTVIAAVSPTPTSTKTATPTPTATAAVSPTPTKTKTATPTPTPTQGPSGWVTIMSEDFEGAFPGQWDVFDNNGTSDGVHFWGKRTCRPYAGSYSGWAVGGGDDGAALNCGSDYPDNADSWMVYGPFSLVGATDGELRFQLWLNSEQSDDQFCWLASLDGNNFEGNCASGISTGWSERVLDLTNVPNLGNLIGQSTVWVALTFTSDNFINYREGAYVDNIVLRKCTSATCPEGSSAAPASDDGQLVVVPTTR